MAVFIDGNQLRCTASREWATEADRLDHQRDHDVARALAFVLCARRRDMEMLSDFLDVIAENPCRTLRLVEITHPAGGRRMSTARCLYH